MTGLPKVALLVALCASLQPSMAIAADDGPINPGVPPKTGAFLAYCKTGKQGCTDEVADISFAMLVTNATKKEWCPTEETQDANLLMHKVIEWLVAHPEVADKATDDGIKMALVQLYPCKD